MVYYIATVKRGIRLHGWNTQTNLSLSLSSSSIHNSQYFSWICGLVVLYRAVGTGGTGGKSPPPLIFAALLEAQPSPSKGFKLLLIHPPDFQTFLWFYCMYICSTLSSSIHYHRQQLSANTTVLVKNTVLCM